MSWMQKMYEIEPALKRENVTLVKRWTEEQPHLPTATEQEVILFLHSCRYSNEGAKSAIDNYFTMRSLSRDIFGDRNPEDSQMRLAMNTVLFSMLPMNTHPGEFTIFLRLRDSNPDNLNIVHMVRLFDMTVMSHLYKYGPVEGLYIVYDMQEVVFGHLMKLTPVVLKKFLLYLQEAMPIRLKGLHYVNVVPFMDKILALIKPFLKKELMDVLYLHEKVDDLLPFVPMECLPKDYGGQAPSISQLHDQMKTEIIANVDFFALQDKQLVDESKRPGKPKNVNDIFGIEGTFKKLDID